MNKVYDEILYNFFILFIFQLLVFNNIVFFNNYIPYIYIFFLITLPANTSNLFLILSAFVIGSIQDIFSGTIGIHSFATVFVAFVRPVILSLYTPLSKYDDNKFLYPGTYGINWFIKYSVTIIMLHSFVLYLIDAFDLTLILSVFLKTFISTLITWILGLAVVYGLIEKVRK